MWCIRLLKWVVVDNCVHKSVKKWIRSLPPNARSGDAKHHPPKFLDMFGGCVVWKVSEYSNPRELKKLNNPKTWAGDEFIANRFVLR